MRQITILESTMDARHCAFLLSRSGRWTDLSAIFAVVTANSLELTFK